jgi:glycerol-3-phosphate cytidylyltransferase
MKKKYHVGYTCGVFDVFHVGHLNLLRHAKEQCDYLIVGVNSDALVMEYKNKKVVIPQDERMEIVEAVRYVDKVVLAETLDKVAAHEKYKFDKIFIGDDWKGNARWAQTEKDLAPYGAQVVYLPHTPDISSTGLRIIREDSVGEEA